MQLDRRTFLASLTALVACKRLDPLDPTDPMDTDTGGPATAPGPTALDAWAQVLDEIQAVLRVSPDHRTARAEALVAAGDPEALFAFVRDGIAARPGTVTAYDAAAVDAETVSTYGGGVRFGPRATLRGGEGSVRDKVELLADLLRRAGLSGVEVVVVPLEPTPDQQWSIFGHARVPEAPMLEVPEETWARWGAVMGVELRDEPVSSRPTAATIEALADRVIAALPASAGASASPYVTTWFGSIPVVRLADGRVLNPLYPSATWDDPGVPTGTLEPASPVETPRLTVRLEGRLRDAPDTPVTLVEGSFDVADLPGRQLLMTALPSAPMRELLSAGRQARFPLRQAVLAVQSTDGTPVPDPVLGSAFTLLGELAEVDVDGTLRVGGNVVARSDDSTGLASQVDAVQVDVDVRSFPRLVVRARALDAAGAPVVPLGRADLEVFDDGVPVPAVLRSNRDSPRVLVLFDHSASMPAAYGEPGFPLDAAVLDAIRGAWPDAIVESRENTGALQDLVRIAEQEATWWDVVVAVTDGETDEPLTPEVLDALARGPVICFLGTADEQPILTEGAVASGGLFQLVTPEDVADVAVELLGRADPPPYVLDVLTQDGGATQRVLSVRIGTAEGTATYVVGAPSLEPSEWIALGVHLTVADRTEYRHLGGFAGYAVEWGELTMAERVGHIHDCLRALEAPRVVLVEAGNPGDSELLEELLRARRSLLPVLDLAGLTEDEIVARCEGGWAMAPFTGRLLQGADVPAEDGVLTFTDRVRVALWEVAVDPSGERSTQRIDLFRLHSERTVVRDGENTAHFLAQVRRSCARALYEASISDRSTDSMLGTQALLALAAGDPVPGVLDADGRIAWRTLRESVPGGWLLVGADPTTVAAWWVDGSTGEVVGLLEAGAGGGLIDRNTGVANINAYVGLITFAMGVGPGVGAVGAFQAEIVKWWAAATAAVEGFVFDSTGLDANLKKGVCDAILSLLTPDIGGALHGLFGTLNANVCNVVESVLNER